MTLSTEQLTNSIQVLNNIINECKEASLELQLAKFWQEYPEIEEFEVSTYSEYDDQGEYTTYISLQSVKCVDITAKENLLSQYDIPEDDLNLELNPPEEKDNYIYDIGILCYTPLEECITCELDLLNNNDELVNESGTFRRQDSKSEKYYIELQQKLAPLLQFFSK